MTLVQGVVLFIFVKLISDFIGFTTISYLMNQVINYGAIAAVVIFAPELRSALETFGRTPQHFLQSKEVSSDEKLVQAFVKAVKYMSPRKIGALVSIEQTQTLQEQIATGIPLDAVVTGELLINIFIPNTPLHDGAVIIRDNKVATACSYLPLTESNKISKEFGTRHRAAIGLSEQTDALTFVVSEETGAISIAYKGNFIHDLSVQEFEQELSLILLKEQEPRQSFFQRWIGGSKKMKCFVNFFKNDRLWQILVALFFAVVLFFTAWSGNAQNKQNSSSASNTFTQTIESVPVDIKYDSDKYFISGYSYDAEVYLTATTQLALTTETSSDTRHFKLVADLSNLGQGTSRVPIQVKDLPAGMSAQVSPSTLTATIGKKASKTFDVVANITSDKLANGYEVKKVSLDATKVEVTSSEDIINQIDHVQAVLEGDSNLSEDYDGNLVLQAVSTNGTVLASSISPAKVHAKISLRKLSKSVPVKVELTGDKASNVSSISYSFNRGHVTIVGSQEAMDKIDSITVPMDISQVTKDTSKTIDLKAEGVTVQPGTVKVNLKVTQK